MSLSHGASYSGISPNLSPQLQHASRRPYAATLCLPADNTTQLGGVVQRAMTATCVRVHFSGKRKNLFWYFLLLVGIAYAVALDFR